jgi:hypothetical protein
MFNKFLGPALFATSALSFNGQAPAAFTKKQLISETSLKLSGGTAPALKVRVEWAFCCIILVLIIFLDYIIYTCFIIPLSNQISATCCSL